MIKLYKLNKIDIKIRHQPLFHHNYNFNLCMATYMSTVDSRIEFVILFPTLNYFLGLYLTNNHKRYYDLFYIILFLI